MGRGRGYRMTGGLVWVSYSLSAFLGAMTGAEMSAGSLWAIFYLALSGKNFYDMWKFIRDMEELQ